jgi:hypothetical protein
MFVARKVFDKSVRFESLFGLFPGISSRLDYVASVGKERRLIEHEAQKAKKAGEIT